MISYRQADLLEYRKKVRIRFYLLVNHSNKIYQSDRNTMLSIYNVIDMDNKEFTGKRSVELAMAFEIFDDYLVKVGGDVSAHIWNQDPDWQKHVQEFEDYLKSRPEITDVEFNLLPNKGGVNSEFNDTYECFFSVFTKLVPKGLE
jgi:hypothetical protein